MRSIGNRLRSQPVVHRTVAAALTGLALPPLAWVFVTTGLAGIPAGDRLGRGLTLAGGAAILLPLVAWPLLWALCVRPAWHVALLAPVMLLLLGVLSRYIVVSPLVAVVVGPPLSYGLAALITTPGSSLGWWPQLPLMAVGGPPPVVTGAPVKEAPAPGRPAVELTGIGIPLLAPDLPSYVLGRVAARPGELRYLLIPAALHRAATPAELDASSIGVTVRVRVDPPAEGSAYERAGLRIWRKDTETGSVQVVDRDDATVVLRFGSRVPAAVIRQVTAALRPCPPSHFTGDPAGS
ncbi:hypothetical protein OG320_13755 [Microbispora sp. NBC_01189]|uniref:hypothetical protein n=1 Tax=Microbispora sp. NBC_01189 TaxID=2903583 RepID=UPI002E127E57|nr:hypothetical protein OG320_13755 [Microbispora sp. NBC_01189]